MSRRLSSVVLVCAVVMAACGSPMYAVRLVNHTPRAIEEIYVYPVGATEHGASRGAIAAGGDSRVRVPGGAIEVLAVSAKVQLDAKTRERRTASSALEVHGPLEVVIYEGEPPALPAGTIGVRLVGDAAPAPASPE